jgi:A118 family predicted phage portal protein
MSNHIDEGSGMGISVYADAIDCLKGVDLAFNNFCRDIKLGGKKVFINQSLICRDGDGNVYTPDDVAQQLFVTIGDTDIAENPMITEHNPSLRSEDNAEAVQSQLDYLSFRCGLGTNHYEFRSVRGVTKMTATQYVGEKQDLQQNAAKHGKNLACFLRRIAESVICLGRDICGLPLTAEGINIRLDDSYFVDSESERSRDLKEMELGVMTREEFRQKWYGTPIASEVALGKEEEE